MSLAAVPAYLLARRVLPTGLSLLAALLAVAVPSMVYTGTLMTENAFYPAFLLVALGARADARASRRCGASSSCSAACGVVALVRVQALALLLARADRAAPAALVARRPLRPCGAALRHRRRRRGARRSSRSSRAARRSSSLLGAYAVVGEESYDVGEVRDYVALARSPSSTSTSA